MLSAKALVVSVFVFRPRSCLEAVLCVLSGEQSLQLGGTARWLSVRVVTGHRHML